MYPGILEFYLNRLEVCTNYGFTAGHDLIATVIHAATFDNMLTKHDFSVILDKAQEAHIKLMEVNYNEQWQ